MKPRVYRETIYTYEGINYRIIKADSVFKLI